MPCSDSSSSMVIKLDHNDLFQTFEYAKITCGQAIEGETGLSVFFFGKTLQEIIDTPFQKINDKLQPQSEEAQFILYSEWDALRCAIGLYLGLDNPDIDTNRCIITSVEVTEKGTEIAEVILPPSEMPKIIACGMAEKLEGEVPNDN